MDSIFGIGIFEFIFILIFALIFLGPERLPKVTRDVLDFIRRLQRLSSELTQQINEEIGDLRELDPRYHMEQIMGDEEDNEGEKDSSKEKDAKETPSKRETSAPSQPQIAAQASTSDVKDTASADKTKTANNTTDKAANTTDKNDKKVTPPQADGSSTAPKASPTTETDAGQAEIEESPQPTGATAQKLLSGQNPSTSTNGIQSGDSDSTDADVEPAESGAQSSENGTEAKQPVARTKPASPGSKPKKRGVKTLAELRKQQQAKRKAKTGETRSSYLEERHNRARGRAQSRRDVKAAQQSADTSAEDALEPAEADDEFADARSNQIAPPGLNSNFAADPQELSPQGETPATDSVAAQAESGPAVTAAEGAEVEEGNGETQA